MKLSQIFGRGAVDEPLAAFNEEAYLELNPDVASAVKSGSLESGYFHYLNYGVAEGRRRATEDDVRLITYRRDYAMATLQSLPYMSDDISLVIQIKDEGSYLIEWLAYYHLLGVTRFIIFDNGSTDETLRIAQSLRERLNLSLIPWPSIQPIEPSQALSHGLVARAASEGVLRGWLLFLDADEFLVLHSHKTLKPFLADYDGMAAIAFNWLLFGSSGHQQRTAGPVIERFQRRAEHSHPLNRACKSIVRAEAMSGEFVHNHWFPLKPNSRYVFPDGTDVPDYREGFWGPNLSYGNSPSNYGIAQLNHYSVKSRDEWTQKLKKGRQGTSFNAGPDTHFDQHDRNEVFDISILPLASQTKRLMKELASMCPR